MKTSMGIGQVLGLAANEQVITATGTLRADKNLVLADASGGAITATLPHPGECPGNIMSIHVIESSNDVTLTAPNSSLLGGNLVMTALADYAVVYSNGRYWVPLVEVTT